ncbi:MAG: hypothetical protein RLZZ127_1508 [Planctomycetota bacterium]|jgi:hypothetical protein
MGPLIRSLLGLLLLCGGLAAPVRAYDPANDVFTVTKVVDNGSDANRLVWVFIGDGYTAGQQATYLSHVNSLLANMFGKEPWSGYRNLVNVYAIQVVSNQSGADEPPNNLYVDTYFGATFWTSNIERLLTINTSAGFTVAQRHVPGYDSVFCVVNATRYGGSGGSLAVCSVNSQAFSIMDHEYGHTLCGLADEYEDPYPGYPAGDSEPNVQINISTAPLKWAAWVTGGTPLPTPETSAYAATVGAFEGARYLSTGVHRPKLNCAMRSLGAGYCEVCRESHVTHLYDLISTCDAASPAPGPVVVANGATQVFTVTPVNPNLSGIAVAWSADGQPLGSTTSLAIAQGSTLPDGTYTLTATLRDQTAWVRNDPGNVLVDTLTWTLHVGTVTPAAGLVAADLAAAAAYRDVTVTYSHPVNAIAVASIDGNDVRVTGPNGFSQAASLVGIDVATDGTPRTATYRIVGPGGAWDAADNGTYSVWMQADQVRDVANGWVKAGYLGGFRCQVPVTAILYAADLTANPGWTLDAAAGWAYGIPTNTGAGGPGAGATGTAVLATVLAGNYPKGSYLSHATTPVIDATAGAGKTVTVQFARWLRKRNGDAAVVEVSGNNGSTWTTVFSDSRAIADGAWSDQAIDITAVAAGQGQVRIRWGLGDDNANGPSKQDDGWNLDDIRVVASSPVVIDTVPPSATAALPGVQAGAGPSYDVTVTYSDASGIAAASIGNGDVRVVGPGGFAQAAVLVGVDQPGDGSPRTATYRIGAPGGTWDGPDAGLYTVSLEQAQVTDLAGNHATAAVLGTFTCATGANAGPQIGVSATAGPGILVLP